MVPSDTDRTATSPFFDRSAEETFAVSLIGMAGAGKSTLGRAVADRLKWAYVDTDRLMEAYFGAPLQIIRERLGLDNFLQAEDHVVTGLYVSRCVVSTGGSVVYSSTAMERLKTLGPVVFLDVPLPIIESRLQDVSNRGLAIADGQSIADLFAERHPLYLKFSSHILPMQGLSVSRAVDRLFDLIDFP